MKKASERETFVDRKLKAAKKKAEELEAAIGALKRARNLEKSWARVMKRGKPISITYWRMVAFTGMGDAPVDMAEVWNLAVKLAPGACRAFHEAVSAALRKLIADRSADVKRLARRAN